MSAPRKEPLRPRACKVDGDVGLNSLNLQLPTEWDDEHAVRSAGPQDPQTAGHRHRKSGHDIWCAFHIDTHATPEIEAEVQVSYPQVPYPCLLCARRGD